MFFQPFVWYKIEFLLKPFSRIVMYPIKIMVRDKIAITTRNHFSLLFRS